MALEDKYLRSRLNEKSYEYSKYEDYYEIILMPHVGKKVNGWKFGYEDMMGAFVFSKNVGGGEQLLYATPYLAGANGVAVNLIDEDGKEQFMEVVKMPKPTGNSAKDTKAYFNALKKYLTV